MSAISRFARLVSKRDGFIRASMVMIGLPVAIVGSWIFSGLDEYAFLAVVPLAFIAAYVWATLMWKFFYSRALTRSPGSEQRSTRSMKE